jgi:hypothetical protein
MIIDLPPNEWRSEREKPKEPIFGPGLPHVVMWLTGFGLALLAGYLIRH